MDYVELDKTTQINSIKTRIREIEQQHLQLSLRVTTPDANQPPNEMDNGLIQRLEDSHGKLLEMLRGIDSPNAS